MKKEDEKMSFIEVINKKDEIYESINSAKIYFEKFLSKKIDPTWDVTSNKIEHNHKLFLENSKTILANVQSFKNKILEKQDQFINYVNMYSLFLTEVMDKKMNTSFKNINHEFKSALSNSQKELDEISNKNKQVIEKKKNFEKITKSKIENIRKSINDKNKFSLEANNEQIKLLLKEYEKFVSNVITIELEKNEEELQKILKKMKNQENMNIENTYNVSSELKNQLKSDLKKIAHYEKDVIVKIIDFQDYLEDIVNFYNDQLAKYKILFKKKRIIKLNSSGEILKDINLLFSQMANTEKLFDNINLSTNSIKRKIEVNQDDKLLKIQSNIIGESESTKTILLENNKISGDEVQNNE